MTNKPFVLAIFDGWGHSDDKFGNAIAAARTPNFDALKARWPHTLVAASGEAVGLPPGQIGNSEVGHLTIGSGRVIRQALGRQLHEIASGSFYENETLITAIELAKERHRALHVMGLVSPGGIHSHQSSAVAVVKLAAQLGLKHVYVHAFTDGRDTLPASAAGYVKQLSAELDSLGVGKIASISGRYFAMDRDNRWDRTRRAYDMLTSRDHPSHPNAAGYIDDRYSHEQYDEFIEPVSIADSPRDRIRLEDGDVVIFFNFRADRARQLTHALVDADFTDFARGRVIQDLHLVTFTEYDDRLNVPVAFPSLRTEQTLAEAVSKAGRNQYHIAETEKYAHVTYFLNGGYEEAFKGEHRKLVPSPKVAYYDEAPAMSAREVTRELVSRLNQNRDQLLVVNYANADMVGHTANFEAAKKAIEVLDECLGTIARETLDSGGVFLMTADHGNAEQEIDAATGKPITAHTTNPVPVILCGTDCARLRDGGGLADIAPTVLRCMKLPAPPEMTGRSLMV